MADRDAIGRRHPGLTGRAGVGLSPPGAGWLDPVSDLVVALIIVYEAAVVFRGNGSALLKSTPADVDLSGRTATTGGVPGVTDVHDLHGWSRSINVRALSARLVLVGLPTLDGSTW